jgi:phosphatidylethanolamine/phosphatidyl-N-methylethanolamine N-methyltransferase
LLFAHLIIPVAAKHSTLLPPEEQKLLMNSLKPDDVINSYRRYAPIYDRLFGAVLEPGRKALAQSVNELSPASLLEIGVGTGLMLPRYPVHTKVVGVDISEEMLEIAHARAHNLKKQSPSRDITLLATNAERLDFADETFDCVTLPYVLSVTPDPQALIAEVRRVCRKEGTIFVLNHFSGSGFWWLLEQSIRPIADRVGFRSDFSFDTQIAKQQWKIQNVSSTNLFGLSKLVELKP